MICVFRMCLFYYSCSFCGLVLNFFVVFTCLVKVNFLPSASNVSWDKRTNHSGVFIVFNPFILAAAARWSVPLWRPLQKETDKVLNEHRFVEICTLRFLLLFPLNTFLLFESFFAGFVFK